MFYLFLRKKNNHPILKISLWESGKKEKDFQKLESLLEEYRKLSDEKLITISTSDGGNKPVIQACNIVLKERGLK